MGFRLNENHWITSLGMTRWRRITSQLIASIIDGLNADASSVGLAAPAPLLLLFGPYTHKAIIPFPIDMAPGLLRVALHINVFISPRILPSCALFILLGMNSQAIAMGYVVSSPYLYLSTGAD